MSNGKSFPPLIDDGFLTVELGLHSPIASNVGNQGVRARDLPEP
jgi:hypothetical protein